MEGGGLYECSGNEQGPLSGVLKCPLRFHRRCVDHLSRKFILKFESFLSQRSFQVNVNGTLSQMAEAISGIPHDSVIGPILFIIYVNYLPNHFSANSPLYADDVKLIAPSP